MKRKACRKQVRAEIRSIPPVPFDPNDALVGRHAIKLAWLRSKCGSCGRCPDMGE